MSNHIEMQSFRLQAMTTEVAALMTQCQSLAFIQFEHHGGIDIGANISVDHILSLAIDLCQSVKAQLPKLETMPGEDREQVVDGFEQTAKNIRAEADKLIPSCDAQASRHLKESLAHGGPAHGPKDAAIVRDVEGEMKVQSHLHCHAAQTQEIRSFVMQVSALCDLCLETICVGAEAAEQKDALLPPETFVG